MKTQLTENLPCFESSSVIEFLEFEFLRRREKNRSYSLRSFARSLSISPGALSQILAGKRPLTLATSKRIARELTLSPDAYAHLQQLISISGAGAPPESQTSKELDLDRFRLIADWYHFAILSLLETRGGKFTPESIAKRLEISVIQANQALKRLTRLQLIAPHKSGWRVLQTGVHTPSDIASAALRQLHREMLMKAQNALEEVPLHLREFGLVTLAISPSKLPLAKKALRNFRRQLAQLLEKGERTEVYNLSMQLFPLTIPRGGCA